MDMLTEIKAAEEKAAAQIAAAKEQAAEQLAAAMAQSLSETAQTREQANAQMQALSAVAEKNQPACVQQILSYL